MAGYSSLGALNAAIKKKVAKSMEEVGRTGEKELSKNLNKWVYNRNSPKTYQRTNQLKASITSETVEKGKSYSTVIYHDSNKMDAIPPKKSNKYMGQHYSTKMQYKTKDYRKYVAQTVNEGSSGHIFGEGYWTKPRPYFTNTEKYMHKNFKKILTKEMRRQGVKTKG